MEAVNPFAPAPEPPAEVAVEPDRQAALRALRNLEATEARLERNAHLVELALRRPPATRRCSRA